jgi:hypothetical protein
MGQVNRYEGCKTAKDLALALQRRLARGRVDIAEVQAVKLIAELRGWPLSGSSQPNNIQPPTTVVIADPIIRARCITDHTFLANDILEMESPDEHEILYGLFPQRQPDIIEPDPIPNRLILWSRGLGKSTAVSVDITQAILHNQNVRILYLTGDDDLGKNRLTQVANVFDKPTEKFAQTFPSLCGLEQRTTHQLVVKGRTNRTNVDPTLLVSTLGQDTTGSRWDLIFLDDLVNLKNSETEAGRNKAFEIYRGIRSQRSADARIVITGTRYDAEDAYGRIEKAVADEGLSQWLIDVRSCWSYRCKNCGHKDLFHQKTGGCYHGCECVNFESNGVRLPIIDRFVTRHGIAVGYTMEMLEHEKSEAGIGARNFALQYENNSAESAGLNLFSVSKERLDEIFGMR